MHTLPEKPIEGPCLSHTEAAKYLIVARRQIYRLEEQGLLVFFKLSPNLSKITKGQLDSFVQRCLAQRMAELEGVRE